MQLLAPDQPHEITHCHFRVMYGGDNLTYWPPASTPVTVVEFADLAKYRAALPGAEVHVFEDRKHFNGERFETSRCFPGQSGCREDR